MIQRIYNCEKTRDFIHEWARYRLAASKSPGMEIVEPWDPDAIERIQKWSDENPDSPKISPEDLAFVKAFKIKENKRIGRRHGKLYVADMFGSKEFEIWPNMFPFIQEGTDITLTDLMQLEVEDE